MVDIRDMLADIDKRLRLLERDVREIKGSPAAPKVKSEAVVERAPTVAPATGFSEVGQRQIDSGFVETEPASPDQKNHSRSEETQLSGSSQMLGLAGIVLLLLAVGFFVKLTIDSGWLTPWRQVLLASITGVFCLLMPQYVPTLGEKYGSFLAGAGVGMLHLTWLFAHSYHQLITHAQAVIAASAVGLISLLVNQMSGNRIFVIVAVAGTYFSCLLGSDTQLRVNEIAAFLIVWNIAFCILSFALERRDTLIMAAFFAILTTALLPRSEVGEAVSVLMLQLSHLGIFSLVLTGYSIFHKKRLTIEESWWVFILLTTLYFHLYSLIESIRPELAGLLGISVASLVLALYVYARKNLKTDEVSLDSGPPLVSFVTIAALHSFYFVWLSEEWRPLVSLILLHGVGLEMFWLGRERRGRWVFPLAIVGFVGLYGLLLTLMSDLSLGALSSYNLVYGLSALCGAILFVSRFSSSDDRVSYKIMLGIAHLEMTLGLYRVAMFYQLSSLFVTAAWGLYALVVLAIGWHRKDRWLGNSAIVVLIVVSFKAFFYDIWNTSQLTRVFSLLVEGALLYGCGWIFEKMKSWKNVARR